MLNALFCSSIAMVLISVQGRIVGFENREKNELGMGPPISEGEKLVAVELAESNPSMVTQPGVPLEDIPWVFAMENMENGKMASKNFFSSHLWDGGIIYYEVTNDMTTDERLMIALAMQTLESSTCLRFLPRDQGQTFYVTIKKNDAGCWAHIGQARGSLNLASQCWSQYVILHELLHTLGMFHEHNRPDRDQFITVNWSNLRRSAYSSFFKSRDGDNPLPVCNDQGQPPFTQCDNGFPTDLYGLPYDVLSITHYTQFAGTSNGEMTLEPKPSGSSVTLGGTTLSELDLLKINTAYECEVLQPPEPTPPEFLSPNGPIYKFPDSNECIKIEGGDGNGVGVKDTWRFHLPTGCAGPLVIKFPSNKMNIPDSRRCRDASLKFWEKGSVLLDRTCGVESLGTLRPLREGGTGNVKIVWRVAEGITGPSFLANVCVKGCEG